MRIAHRYVHLYHVTGHLSKGETKFLPQLGSTDPSGPQFGQGDGLISFGETFPVFIGEEWMMMITWRGQSEEGLKQAVEVGCFEEVDSPDDIGDALKGIIMHHGEVVAGTDVFADQDGVAKEFGAGHLPSGGILVPR